MANVNGYSISIDDREVVQALNRLNNDVQNVIINYLKGEALTLQREFRQKLTDNGSVKSGDLRRSITVRPVNKWTYEVGTNLFYAPYVEYGTRRMGAKPYIKPVLDNNSERIVSELTALIRGALR